MAFCYKPRECLRAKVVHKPFFGTLPKHASLPGPGVLVAMLAVCQIPKLPTGFCIGDCFFGVF